MNVASTTKLYFIECTFFKIAKTIKRLHIAKENYDGHSSFMNRFYDYEERYGLRPIPKSSSFHEIKIYYGYND